jgi:hypothetical protein
MSTLLNQLVETVKASPYQAAFYGLVAALVARKVLKRNTPAIKNVGPLIKNPKVCIMDFVYGSCWPISLGLSVSGFGSIFVSVFKLFVFADYSRELL